MTTEHFDAIVIGSGQGGGPLAGKFAGSGMRTALIERSHAGGNCVNEGCTPTKTMVASARVTHLAHRAADYGVHCDGHLSVDQKVVRKRKRDIVESFRSGSEKKLLETTNLDLVMGEAKFTGPHTIHVQLNEGGDRSFASDTIVINTGARPRVPSIEGLDDTPYLDSTTIMELGEVPRHLIILGGGFIALEFGQMFRRFGSEVTVVEQGRRLAPREDDDVCDALRQILQDDGIIVELQAVARKASYEGREVLLEINQDGDDEILRGSHLLVAVGRIPNSEALNLESADIETSESGHIVVDERLETSASGVYAIGDVKGGPAFTHISYDDHRILSANLLEGRSATVADRMVPYTVFIDPQYGRIGLSERQAGEKEIEYSLAKIPMKHVARAIETDETRGFMKVLIDPYTDQILGCAILGIEGGEVMSMLQIAMMGDLPYTKLRDATFAHPTLAESLNNLFASVAPS